MATLFLKEDCYNYCGSKIINRERTLKLLVKYNKEEYHVRHGLMVEAIMRYIAEKNDYDVEFWGIVGLLHDVDYELFYECN